LAPGMVVHAWQDQFCSWLSGQYAAALRNTYGSAAAAWYPLVSCVKLHTTPLLRQAFSSSGAGINDCTLPLKLNVKSGQRKQGHGVVQVRRLRLRMVGGKGAGRGREGGGKGGEGGGGEGTATDASTPA
jgi:hypothetical protein